MAFLDAEFLAVNAVFGAGFFDQGADAFLDGPVGDCYMYGLLASGYMDACIEASLSPYDFCALVPVVEGAGGIITDWSGNDLTIKSDGRILAAGNTTTHAALLSLL